MTVSSRGAGSVSSRGAASVSSRGAGAPRLMIGAGASGPRTAAGAARLLFDLAFRWRWPRKYLLTLPRASLVTSDFVLLKFVIFSQYCKTCMRKKKR